MGRKDGGEKRKQKMIMPKVLKYKITESHRSSSLFIGTEYQGLFVHLPASPRTKIHLDFSRNVEEQVLVEETHP